MTSQEQMAAADTSIKTGTNASAGTPTICRLTQTGIVGHMDIASASTIAAAPANSKKAATKIMRQEKRIWEAARTTKIGSKSDGSNQGRHSKRRLF